MPYLCWIYNGDGRQHEIVGINTCAIDMMNALSTDKTNILLVAHSSDYVCRLSLHIFRTYKTVC